MNRSSLRRVLMSLLFGLCAARPAAAQTYEVVHSFVIPGSIPRGALAVSPTGVLYGTQETGGVFRRGSVFSLSPDGSGGFTLLTLHSFSGPDGASPRSTLIFGADGNLYGTTPVGGGTGAGTVFRITQSGAFIRLHDFADGGGKSPSELILASDGAFYGTASEGGAHDGGTIFRIGPDTAFSTVHDFDGTVEGTAPLAGLAETDYGRLWGTTSLGGAAGFGTVFRLDLPATVVTVHDFQGTDGSAPAAAMTRAVDGLYGTTRAGGANNSGTVFRIDELGTLTTLKSLDFNSGDTPIAPLYQWSDGKFYGTTTSGGPGGGKDDFPAGTVFRIDAAGTFERLYGFNGGILFGTPGSSPFGGLADGGDGFLYGTTTGQGYGTIYRISLAGALTYPYLFAGVGDGEGISSPIGPLTEMNGAIYGAATSYGGLLFRLDGSVATIFHHFTGPDGSAPNAGLILGSDGDLYGTTQSGGANFKGTAFRIDAAGTLETLHSFAGADGSGPAAGLIENPDGEFYGTTSGGGALDFGTVFHMSNTGTVTTLHEFTSALDDGAYPLAPLIHAADGSFFGTTNFGGGTGAFGTIFKLDNLGAVTTFYSFLDPDTLFPEGPVLQASDGDFYGTTASGGAFGPGVLFRVDAAGTLTNLHSFAGPDGTSPGSGLIQASDGLLYGTAFGGGSPDFGTVFRTDLLGNFEVVHAFVGTDGSSPYGGLLEASDGTLYGAANTGGFGGGGVVYRLAIAAAAASVTAIDPVSGRAAGGTPVAITGEHLYGVSVVTIGGAAATAPAVRDQGQIFTVSPALQAGTLNDVTVGGPEIRENAGPTLAAAWFADFNDVPQDDIFHAYIETIFRAGITAGCGGGNYCLNDAVRRDQMAVFLLKAEHGSDYVPPACTPVFADVACPGTFADWIGQLVTEGVTAGCGGGNYCPSSPVTRAQMAVFLLKTKDGSSYVPPPAVGVFNDVPQDDSFAPWIEEIAHRGITGGCHTDPPDYCPARPNTRGEMAVFLVKTFSL